MLPSLVHPYEMQSPGDKGACVKCHERVSKKIYHRPETFGNWILTLSLYIFALSSNFKSPTNCCCWWWWWWWCVCILVTYTLGDSTEEMPQDCSLTILRSFAVRIMRAWGPPCFWHYGHVFLLENLIGIFRNIYPTIIVYIWLILIILGSCVL